MKALDRLRNLMQDCSRVHTTIGDGWHQSLYVDVPEELLDSCIDEIERELKERYIELPLDKDGVPIRVGDKMMDKEKVGFVVSELNFTGTFVHVFAILGGIGYVYEPSKIRHYNGTIEEALREFAIVCEDAGNAGDAVNRLINEYAERLQLKEEQE